MICYIKAKDHLLTGVSKGQLSLRKNFTKKKNVDYNL